MIKLSKSKSLQDAGFLLCDKFKNQIIINYIAEQGIGKY